MADVTLSRLFSTDCLWLQHHSALQMSSSLALSSVEAGAVVKYKDGLNFPEDFGWARNLGLVRDDEGAALEALILSVWESGHGEAGCAALPASVSLSRMLFTKAQKPKLAFGPGAGSLRLFLWCALCLLLHSLPFLCGSLGVRVALACFSASASPRYGLRHPKHLSVLSPGTRYGNGGVPSGQMHISISHGRILVRSKAGCAAPLG